jgi:predicted TIM-barrel fold metal-dependent hydrolase
MPAAATALPYRLIDADSHYYEPDECCTRHLEARYRERAVHCVRASDGSGEWHFGERPLAFHRGARDFVLPPGGLQDFIAGRATAGPGQMPKVIGSDQPAFRDREARLRALDKFGVEATLVLPSFGVSWDAETMDDPEAHYANLRAFNRWVEQDWGFAWQGRIFAPALLSLVDPDRAVAELERLLAAGVRLVAIRPGPIGGRSPADPVFDPFWARVNEARLPVVLHIGVSGYVQTLGALWGEDPRVAEHEMSPFQWVTCFGKRPIMDMVAALVLHNLFGRFRNLRMLSIENGSTWIAGLLDDMDKAAKFSISSQGDLRAASRFGRIHDAPSRIFREHFWVTPFYEEDVAALARCIGVERVLFGSDWPHPEGVPAPADFVKEVATLPADAQRRILRENTRELLGLPA